MNSNRRIRARSRSRRMGVRGQRRPRCWGGPAGRSRRRQPATASTTSCRRTRPPSSVVWRCVRRRSRRRNGPAPWRFRRSRADSTVTPSPVSVIRRLIGQSQATSTCSNLSRPRSSSASTSGCTNPLRLGQPKHASGGAISASTRRWASKNRRIWFGTVCGRTRSTRPTDWNVRSASSSSPTPRG